MATVPQVSVREAVTAAPARASRSRFSFERILSPLLLAPSVVAVFLFVYGFIGITFWVSLSNWRSAGGRPVAPPPIGDSYQVLFSQSRFQIDLRNTLLFTFDLPAPRGRGWLGLAVLLDRKITGSGFFRSVFLFPYALSFITTGVTWSWIFNPETGVNLLFGPRSASTPSSLLRVEPLKPGWITDGTVAWQLNGVIAAVYRRRPTGRSCSAYRSP
jgi:glucose/mannose transport system permease protein